MFSRIVWLNCIFTAKLFQRYNRTAPYSKAVSRFPIPTELELIAWARKKYSWRCWDFTVRHFISLLLRCRKNVLEKNLAPSTNQMRYARSEIRFLGNLAFKLHTLFALYGETNSELSTWNNNNRAMDALDGISFLLPYLKQNVQCRGQLWTAHTLQSNYHANKF